MSVKEKRVTGNLTQKQRYKKFISKDTKILKFSTQKQQYSKEYYIMTKVGIMFIINLV